MIQPSSKAAITNAEIHLTQKDSLLVISSEHHNVQMCSVVTDLNLTVWRQRPSGQARVNTT